MLSIEQEKLLSLSVFSPSEWIENAVEAQISRTIANIKSSEDWTNIIVAASKDGVDIADENAIVLFAHDNGLLKTAAQKQADFEAEQSTGVTVPDTTAPTPELVDQEVIKRKMALVGASDANQLNDIILKGTREAVKLLQAKSDGAWTDEQAARAVQLDGIETAFEGLETVGELLKADIASGAITKTDEIASDPRWPPFGA